MVQAVDTLFQRRFLNVGGSIFVLDFTLHTECADVIAGTLNPQDTAEFFVNKIKIVVETFAQVEI